MRLKLKFEFCNITMIHFRFVPLNVSKPRLINMQLELKGSLLNYAKPVVDVTSALKKNPFAENLLQ